MVGRGWLGDLRGVKDGCVGVLKIDFLTGEKGSFLGVSRGDFP